MKKNNFVLLFVFVLLIGNLAFVFAGELISKTPEVGDIDELLGLEDVEIYCENCNYQILNDKIAVYFTNNDSKFVKDGNVFDGIDFEKNCYIQLDYKGKIIGADLWTGSEKKVFVFENKEVEVSANSQFLFDNEKGIINAADNSVVSKIPSYSEDFSLEISGNNVLISDDLLLEDGTIRLVKEGFLLKEGKANYKNIDVGFYSYKKEAGVFL